MIKLPTYLHYHDIKSSNCINLIQGYLIKYSLIIITILKYYYNKFSERIQKIYKNTLRFNEFVVSQLKIRIYINKFFKNFLQNFTIKNYLFGR